MSQREKTQGKLESTLNQTKMKIQHIRTCEGN